MSRLKNELSVSSDGVPHALSIFFLGGSIVGYPRLRLKGDPAHGVYNLTISDASLTDDGEYQCQVGPYGRSKAIRANAHLVVICEYIIQLWGGIMSTGCCHEPDLKN